MRVTTLSESFSLSDLVSEQGSKLYPLFAIDKNDRIHVFTDETTMIPEAGWSVISLDQSPQEQEAEAVVHCSDTPSTQE